MNLHIDVHQNKPPPPKTGNVVISIEGGGAIYSDAGAFLCDIQIGNLWMSVSINSGALEPGIRSFSQALFAATRDGAAQIITIDPDAEVVIPQANGNLDTDLRSLVGEMLVAHSKGKARIEDDAYPSTGPIGWLIETISA